MPHLVHDPSNRELLGATLTLYVGDMAAQSARN
jgi:hypothetical protein